MENLYFFLDLVKVHSCILCWPFRLIAPGSKTQLRYCYHFIAFFTLLMNWYAMICTWLWTIAAYCVTCVAVHYWHTAQLYWAVDNRQRHSEGHCAVKIRSEIVEVVDRDVSSKIAHTELSTQCQLPEAAVRWFSFLFHNMHYNAGLGLTFRRFF